MLSRGVPSAIGDANINVEDYECFDGRDNTSTLAEKRMTALDRGWNLSLKGRYLRFISGFRFQTVVRGFTAYHTDCHGPRDI